MEILEAALLILSVGFTGAGLILAYCFNGSKPTLTEAEIKNRHNFSTGVATVTLIITFVVFATSL